MDPMTAIRRSAIACVLALLAAVLTIGLSSHYLAQARAERTEAAQARQHSAALLSELQTGKRELSIYQPRFEQLQNEGMLGGERRLGWTEAIRQIHAARKLLPISFEFSPEESVVMNPPFALGSYRLRASRMRFQMGLLHEMDLFNFLGGLRERGLLTVQDCAIRRNDTLADSIKSARLSASCTLVWLTLEDKR
jgi:hypothetical protein